MLILGEIVSTAIPSFPVVATFSTAPPGQFPDPPHPAASGGPSRRSRPPLCDHSPSSLEPMARQWLILQHQRDRQHLAHAARASFDRPAAARNSDAVSSLRVIAIPAMPASCPAGGIDSDFARLGNPQRVRGEGFWYEAVFALPCRVCLVGVRPLQRASSRGNLARLQAAIVRVKRARTRSTPRSTV